MNVTVAVDIGGTQIRAAAYEPNSIIPAKRHRTRTRAAEAGVFDRLVQTIEAVWFEHKVTAIGIASPGPLDPHTGTILDTPNITQWVNFPVGARLREHFGVPVYLDNDANMAGLAEWQYGAGKGHNDLMYFTISTGIGGGAVSGGCLIQGYRGMGAEVGHMIIESLKKHVFHRHYLDNLIITKAALGDDAGLLGALALARMKTEQ